MTNREKRTIAGPLMEVDFYPVWDDGRRIPERAPKTKQTTEAQQKYNEEQARRKMIMRINANFGPSDYWMHPTYLPERAPQDAKEAKRDLTNYIRRVRKAREHELKECAEKLTAAKAALDQSGECSTPSGRKKAARASAYLKEEIRQLTKQVKQLRQPLKYYYCIERQEYKSGPNKGRTNWHFHLFITGGLTDRKMEALWQNSVRVNCDNFQPERFGPEAAARYMGKESADGRRRFGGSRNLKKPDEKIRDGRFTRRQVEKIATQRVGEAIWWERQYPGYRFLRCFSRFNEYNSNWYVTAVMYKTDQPAPAWLDQWSVSDHGDDGNDIPGTVSI